ncbi:MAG: undecaprenyldiphospho-muramoylpentapeptide beta-N-acetylglucosaminyltransferase [Rikenellaceae bacterium]|nr:undecaprenyldiphospho-muramoylpentapeptide beta-N-acetylglucosaminyltransferase [Rikenellaceae bacterium]
MKRIILSGGGTGGHIYPAVSVAEELKRQFGNDVELLFIGAEGKMEMERVPALGYRIEGLPVAGLQRRLTLKNLLLPIKVLRSLNKARKIIRSFKPDLVVGFGGYASAPVLWSAQMMGIRTIIQEQNSYAGLTNKILSRRAERICVAYDNMQRFFPAEKITMTGNPLRGNFSDIEFKNKAAYEYFGLSADKPVVLITGGSLGTRTLNSAVMSHLERLVNEQKFQIIWQTGKFYEKQIDQALEGRELRGIWRGAFIERMDYAYSIADVVVARAGACTVSELSLVGKAVIFVPSPNVAEDHQTKNAQALSSRDAALLIADSEAVGKVIPTVEELLDNPERIKQLEKNIKQLGISDSAARIVSCFGLK